MVRTLIVFYHYICLLHVFIDEFTIKSKLFRADIVRPRPKWLLHLFFFLCKFWVFLLISIIECFRSSFDSPLNEFDKFDNFLRCLISSHHFRMLSCQSLLHIPLSLVNQIYIIWIKLRLLLLKVHVDRFELFLDHLSLVTHKFVIILIHFNIASLLRCQMLHPLLFLQGFYIEIGTSFVSIVKKKLSFNVSIFHLFIWYIWQIQRRGHLLLKLLCTLREWELSLLL